MRKQVNLKAKFLSGQKKKTKEILHRIKRDSGLTEFLRMKMLLKIANYVGNVDIGYVKYKTVLDTASKSKNSIQLLEDQFGYRIDGNTVEEMNLGDWAYVRNFRLFSVPTDAILKLDTKRIQKALAELPDLIEKRRRMLNNARPIN